MAESYSITCSHCGYNIAAGDMDRRRTCPACGRELGPADGVGYRPASNSPIAKTVAVVIVIAIGLMMVIGILVLIFF